LRKKGWTRNEPNSRQTNAADQGQESVSHAEDSKVLFAAGTPDVLEAGRYVRRAEIRASSPDLGSAVEGLGPAKAGPHE